MFLRIRLLSNYTIQKEKNNEKQETTKYVKHFLKDIYENHRAFSFSFYHL